MNSLRPTLRRLVRPHSTQPPSHHARIKAHYIAQGDSPLESASLATQELRWLIAHSSSSSTTLSSLVDDLLAHKPLAYILGTQPFHPLPLPLLIRPPILIPRPETEHWVSQLASFLSLPPDRPLRILDIGTGSGCIPLALAHALRPGLLAIGVDTGLPALTLARENVVRCGMEKEVRIVQGDVFARTFVEEMRREGGGGFDVVVSNPPYITRRGYEGLSESVRGWEDRGALLGEREGEEGRDDGLVFYSRIVGIVKELLEEKGEPTITGGPVLALEVGEGQAQEVGRMVEAVGLRMEVQKDQWGIERVVLGYRE